jgi:hypothetical protein
MYTLSAQESEMTMSLAELRREHKEKWLLLMLPKEPAMSQNKPLGRW